MEVTLVESCERHARVVIIKSCSTTPPFFRQDQEFLSVQQQNFSIQEKITICESTLLTIFHYLDPKSPLFDTIPCKHHQNIEFDGIPWSQMAGKLCPCNKQFTLFIFHYKCIIYLHQLCTDIIKFFH